MPEADPIDFPDEADKEAALEEFHDAMRAAEARLKSVYRRSSLVRSPPSPNTSALVGAPEGAGACVTSSGACGMDGTWLISSTFLTASMAR